MPSINDITVEFIPVNFNIPAVLKTKTVTENGVYDAQADGADGFSSVTVVVPDRELIINPLSVDPAAEAQTIEVPHGVDGYGPVIVNAPTADVDPNIKSENIKEGVSILGVSGSVIELNGETQDVSITNKNGNTFTPSNGKNAIISINVTPTNLDRTIDPSTSQQTFGVSSGYSGNGTITVNAVTSSIDANIQPGNIKENVTILGTTGTLYVPQYYLEKRNLDVWAGGYCTYMTKVIDLTGITKIGQYGLACAYAHGYYGSDSFPQQDYHYGNPPYYPDFSNITAVAECGLYKAFYSCSTAGNVSFPGITSINAGNQGSHFEDAFCQSGITSFAMDNLTTLSGDRLFYRCFSSSKIESVSFDKLESITFGGNVFGYAFQYCTRLTSVNFRSLKIVNGTECLSYAFSNCTGLTSVTFDSLDDIKTPSPMRRTFERCTSLQTLSFPALKTTSFNTYTNVMYDVLFGVTGCTVHFPSNMADTMAVQGASNGFGGTNTVILYDLPATE